jgi:tRNA(Ile)-lysidine synthase
VRRSLGCARRILKALLICEALPDIVRQGVTVKTELRQQILETIRRYRMMKPGDRVGVAVSGGADSTALLCLLEELREDLGIALQVIHLNHSLRGAQSDRDEEFVAQLSRARELEFFSERHDAGAEARHHGWNLEDAGRRLRYELFERLVREGKVTRVAVAHTADDQAETFFARIFRGTGTRGLAGIHPVRGNIVRPLLKIRREALREYLRERAQTWREDPSNRDLSRLRSRVRHELIPELERKFPPGIVNRITNFAGIFYDEEAFWSVLVEDRFRAVARQNSGGISIAVGDLLSPLPLPSGQESMPGYTEAESASRAVSRRLILRLLEEALRDRGQITSAHVDDVIRFALTGASGHRLELPHGLAVRREFDHLTFFLRSPADRTDIGQRSAHSADAYQYVMGLPGQGSNDVSVPELRTRFCLKLIDWPATERDTRKQSATLDADLLQSPLVLRSWRPGDAYRPRGHRQVRKLKEMFLRHRVPVGERAHWPVLTSGDEVVWTRGMPPAAEFAAQEGTRKGLLIEEEGLSARA